MIISITGCSPSFQNLLCFQLKSVLNILSDQYFMLSIEQLFRLTFYSFNNVNKYNNQFRFVTVQSI